jgi:pSer/pThr/pTyr-binding forkhead associated (FHA) protein
MITKPFRRRSFARVARKLGSRSMAVGHRLPEAPGIIGRVSNPDRDHLARAAYETYRAAQSSPPPSWDDIPEQERHAWSMAISAVAGQPDATIAAEGVKAQQIIIDSADQTHVFHSDFTAGRQGTLPIRDEHASSHHCLFQSAHGLWYVEDLGSTNGTYLNGRRVITAQRLKKGDKVRIGHSTVTVVSVGGR